MKKIKFRVTEDQAVMTVQDSNGREHDFQMLHDGIVTVLSTVADASFKAMQLANTDGTGSLMATFAVKKIEAYKADNGNPLIVALLNNGARLPLALTPEQCDDIKLASDAMQASSAKH